MSRDTVVGKGEVLTSIKMPPGYSFAVSSSHTIEGPQYNIVFGKDHIVVPTDIIENDPVLLYLREKLVSDKRLCVEHVQIPCTDCVLDIPNRKYWEEVILPGLIDIARKYKCELVIGVPQGDKIQIIMNWDSRPFKLKEIT